MKLPFLLLALALSLAAADPLAQYRALLLTLQQQEELPTPSYTRLEALLIPWLEAQLAAGSTQNQIEQHLQSAGIFVPQGTHVGAVTSVSLDPIPDSSLHQLTVSLRQLASNDHVCGGIISILIYQANPYRRLHHFRPNPKSELLAPYALHLTQPEAKGHRYLATSWTTSRCTSTFTGVTFRLHRLGLDGPPLWEKSDSAQQFDESNFIPQRHSDTIYFPFYRPLRDDALTLGRDLFAVRLTPNGPRDASPRAASIAAFLRRWLDAQPGSPSFDWISYGRCGSPTEIELGITRNNQPIYLRISAALAHSLRILRTANTRTCPTLDYSPNLPPVFDLLPPYSQLPLFPEK